MVASKVTEVPRGGSTGLRLAENQKKTSFLDTFLLIVAHQALDPSYFADFCRFFLFLQSIFYFGLFVYECARFFKKYSIILSSFILFNAWWLFSLLYSVTSALQIYSASFAKSWLEQTITSAESPLAKGLIFTQALGPAGWDFFGSF